MKIRCKILLCLPLICLTALDALAQGRSVTLDGGHVAVREAIEAIERQTGCHVSYDKERLDPARRLALPRTTMPLETLLGHIVAGQPVKYLIRGNYIAFVPAADNSRPQVRRQPAPDVPRVVGASRPAPPTPAVPPTVRAVEAPTAPPAPQYSRYRELGSYRVMPSGAPRFALRTNLLYGAATLTPNLAAEVALSRRATLALSYSNNPWNYEAELPSNKKMLHGIVRAEYRRWLCERFNGHFFGLHALYSEYNVSGHDLPTLFQKEYRYRGNAWGGGASYGYAMPLGRQWNLEFTAGAGVLRLDYDRYSCLTCDTQALPRSRTWFGPTNLGVNLVFLIK